MCNFLSFLSSCENWVTQIWKFLIQLDSSHQYNRFEVQHAYVMIKIKEVMSNPIFLEFLLHVLIPIFYDSCSDTFISLLISPFHHLSLFMSPFIYSSYPSSHSSSIHLTVHLFKLPLHLTLQPLHHNFHLTLQLFISLFICSIYLFISLTIAKIFFHLLISPVISLFIIPYISLFISLFISKLPLHLTHLSSHLSSHLIKKTKSQMKGEMKSEMKR